MISILFISGDCGSRRWEHELLKRLRGAGHAVQVRLSPADQQDNNRLDQMLALEARRFGASLLTRFPSLPVDEPGTMSADVVIDLTGAATVAGLPVLRLQFNGQSSLVSGLATVLAHRDEPELRILCDGIAVGLARPMVGDRLWISRASDDVLAGAIALVEQAVARFEAGSLRPLAEAGPSTRAVPKGLTRYYLPFLFRGLAGRLAGKLMPGSRPFYWQVAYRLIDGPGIAETGALDGPAFSVVPDDGARFYADPFPVEHQGRRYLFVEEFPYATGKGVISVALLGEDGLFERPHIVLEEPHHLSYPQIIEHDGAIYMLPESSAARELVLYRAVQFPDQWVRDTVLIADRDINDATLVRRGGQFWLIATERFGHGSASDKMVIYGADDLRGPWRPHRLNPVSIHHSAARPGGHVIEKDGRLVLPVQNGSARYGGGLGLMTIERLDTEDVVLSAVRAIGSGPAWARSGIHTLNRAGVLEVVDSAG